ncbi:ParA family protein [Enterococcus gallinarum]|uniref:ParA family protein n=1 Tax=Enterococcus gallinarum TaxID=1353 RepID=UPI00255AE8BC|nr:ParA family protein [Enterococcus gallinarum]MDL4922399.1 ParA family protein [Enterococcus gallinarum]MDL4984168.1 ParA family protein [Enterococcus gallinarum]MDL4987435.1 ParA family protein [Enterococcus gallinarum]
MKNKQQCLDVLVVDMDAQTNATKALMVIKSVNNPEEVISIQKTIMRGVQEGSLEGIAVEIVDHLQLLPTLIEFEDFAKYLYKSTDSDYEADHLFSKLLKLLKKDVDLIILDIPPLNIECTKNAVLASEYVLISLQTQTRSLDGAEQFVKQRKKVSAKYDHNVEIVGVLPVMLKKQRASDQFILDQSKVSFGEGNLFQQVIPNLDRVPTQDLKRIVLEDRHDMRLNTVFTNIAYEFLERLYYFENQGVVA